MTNRWSKTFLIVWAFTIAYSFLFVYPSAYEFQRFSGRFIVFFELWNHGHIPADYPMSIPFFGRPDASQLPLPSQMSDVVHTYINYPLLLYFSDVVTRVMGVSIENFVRFPISVFITPVIAIATIRRFTRDLAPQVAVFLSIYFLTTISFKLTYVSAIGDPLFLLCLYFTAGVLFYPRDCNFDILGLIFTVVALSLVWHTLLIAAATLTAALVISDYILSATSDRPANHRYWVCALCVGMISIIGFRHWGSGFFTSIAVGSRGFLPLLIENSISKLMGEIAFEVPYKHNYRSLRGGDVYFYSKLGLTVLSIFFLIFAASRHFISWNKSSKLKETEYRSILLSGGVMGAQGIMSILYASAGFGLRFVPHIFIIIGSYAFATRETGRRLVPISIAVFILLSSGMMYGEHVSENLGRDPLTDFGDSRASSEWMMDYLDNEPIVADFHTVSMYMTREIRAGEPTMDWKRLQWRDYAVFVGDEPTTNGLHSAYGVVDMKTMSEGYPVLGYGARARLTPKLNSIETNPSNQKIYSDGDISIVQFH